MDWSYRPAADTGLAGTDRWKSVRREAGLMSWTSQSLWRVLSGVVFRGYHRLSIIGRENLPQKAPMVLVANHTSHLDALILSVILPWRIREHACPIAAGDTFFVGKMSTAFAAFLLNALPLWRRACGTHALEDLRARLVDGGSSFILFPEGTRARDGKLASFKPGIGMLVAGSPVPVVPCALEGCFEALPPDASIPRPRKITVRIGRARSFEDIPNTREGWKQIASILHDDVATLQQKPR